jgi:hypothetical protein
MSELVLAVLTLQACVYGASAASKVAGRAAFVSFRAGMRATGLIPEPSLRVVTVLLVSAEVGVAAVSATAAAGMALAPRRGVLLAGSALGVGCVLIATLLGGVVLVVRGGTQARCRCFGATSSRPLSAVHLVRNSFLLVIVAIALAVNVFRGPGVTASGAGDLVAAASGLIGALLFIRWDDLAEVVLPMQGPAARRARTHAHPARASARAGRPL